MDYHRSHEHEQELVRLVQDGDQAALSEMYTLYSPALLRFAFTILRDEDESIDAVHDVFADIITVIRQQRFTVNSSLSAVLYQSVRYKVFRRIRRTKLSEEYNQILRQNFSEYDHHTENFIAEKETRRSIDIGLSQLPPVTREVFILSREENLTGREISERLNIDHRTVKRHMARAIKALQTRLGSFLSFF